MRTKRTTSPDLRATTWATTHHGLVTREIALNSGMSHHEIDSRLALGRWRRIGPGVYAVAGAPDTWKQRAAATWLAGGEGAAVSHVTAAALHGLTKPPSNPQITIPPGSHQHRQLGVICRSPLEPQDLTVIDSIRVTKPARTLVDCSMLWSEGRLSKLIDTALTTRLCCPRDIWAALDRVEHRPGRKGSGRLRRTLSVWDDPIVPGSPAEVHLLRRLIAWGFAAPITQQTIRTPSGDFIARVDVAWPDKRVALEYDGQLYHGPRHWEHDEVRHAAIVSVGWEVRHVEKDDLTLGASELRAFLTRHLARSAA